MLVLHLLLMPLLGMAESAKEEDPRIVHGQVDLSHTKIYLILRVFSQLSPHLTPRLGLGRTGT